MTSKTVEPKVQSLKVTAAVAVTIQSFGATVVTPGVMLTCEVVGSHAEEFVAKLQELFEKCNDEIPF